MRRMFFVYIITLLVSIWCFAQTNGDELPASSDTMTLNQPADWQGAFLRRLTERLVNSQIPDSTIKLILNEAAGGLLPRNPQVAADRVFQLAKKYDSKLRKGYTYSQVILELRKELYLDRTDNNANKLLILLYTSDEYDKIKIKDKKDKKDKDLKDKIKEDKDKDKDK
ncbi:MAG: hypothetical protein P8107_10225 [Spirochaetia bacterium]